MRRVRVLLVIVTGAVSMLLPTDASADPPVRGCPTSRWVLAPNPTGDVSGNIDQNHDGMSCFLEAPVGSGIFTIIDNVVPIR